MDVSVASPERPLKVTPPLTAVITRHGRLLMRLELQTIRCGYDRRTCWVHARPGIIPAGTAGAPMIGVVTMQKLRLTGDDVFYELNDVRSDDDGRTWSEPTPHPDTLGRRLEDDGIEEGICDFAPGWHAGSGMLLGVGQTVRYHNDEQQAYPRPRRTGYSVYDPDSRTWSRWRKLELPDEPKFFSEGAGCPQWVELPDGEILLPTYISRTGDAAIRDRLHAATILRCAFDGQTLTYLEHGTELTRDDGRGFVEPALARADGRFFLTLRNDHAGYVAVSDDGLHFDDPRSWTFDDGTDLGNYNTQQKWVTLGDDLYLVYTRRGADNDHVMRRRAPLFIAQVDTDRLCVIRDTERILVPQRGARLGNFGVARVSDHESWVTVTEWMQTTLPDPSDCRVCEQYGSDNSVFLAKIHAD